MEILSENRIIDSKVLKDPMREAQELIAIFVSTLNTSRGIGS
jgi:hypothetical protein